MMVCPAIFVKKEAILSDLLPRGVATQIFSALLENGASEDARAGSKRQAEQAAAQALLDRLEGEVS